MDGPGRLPLGGLDSSGILMAGEGLGSDELPESPLFGGGVKLTSESDTQVMTLKPVHLSLSSHISPVFMIRVEPHSTTALLHSTKSLATSKPFCRQKLSAAGRPQPAPNRAQ